MTPTVHQIEAVTALKELHPNGEIREIPLATGTRIMRIFKDGELVESWYVRPDGYSIRAYPFRHPLAMFLAMERDVVPS